MSIPNQLKQQEFRFVLISKGKKNPFEDGWNTTHCYPFDNEKLKVHLENGNNYGVVGGYGNLIVLDFDNLDFQNKYVPLLPKTFSVLSGTGKLHLYFITDNPVSFKIFDSEMNTLLDVQGTGKQVVGAGSLHPNGNTYRVNDDISLAFIPMAELRALFAEYLKPEDRKDKFIEIMPKDETVIKIKKNVSVRDKLQSYGIDTSRNPTKCPMHGSKGGKCLSFTNELWHCFHCDKGGDVFSLVMEHEGTDFVSAKHKLAKECGIPDIVAMKVPTLTITNYADNAKLFWESQPYFYDEAGMFWLWNRELTKWEMADEVDMMRIFDDALGFQGQTITSACKNNHLEAFKRYGREMCPADAPVTWVQFRDKIFDIKTKTTFPATPAYFTCNPIPYSLGESADTPVLDKMVEEWVGKEYVQTLYEIIAYCCLIDYPIHLIFCFIGCGRNGKTTFQTMIRKFIGIDNISSTELDALLDSRFESCKLYKKLVTVVGETNFNMLERTTLLKKLSGQDLVGIEFKNKKPIDAVNYAKILINSNSLPTSLDNSEGFYRRFMIIDFPNEFPEGKDILHIVPEVEYNNLAVKITKILPELLERHSFTNQGSVIERRQKYILSSNPLAKFLELTCEKGVHNFVRYGELFNAYQAFLFKLKRRQVTNKEFKNVLSEENLLIERTTRTISNEYVTSLFVFGIQLKSKWEEICSKCTLSLLSDSLPIREKPSTENSDFTHKDNKPNISDDTGNSKQAITEDVKMPISIDCIRETSIEKEEFCLTYGDHSYEYHTRKGNLYQFKGEDGKLYVQKTI